MNNDSLDCIVPFYQEGQRVIKVAKTLLRVPLIRRIVCVDDGSVDKIHRQLSALSSQILVVRHKVNQGKTAAVKTGLSNCRADHILLIDSDLQNLNAIEISQGLRHYFYDSHTGMLLFKRKNELLVSRLFRFNVVFTGERVLAARDLQQVLHKQVDGYQLEYLINQHMIKLQKNVKVYNISALNTHKPQKFGYVRGISREIAMYASMRQRAKPKHLMYQLTNFARDEIN